MYCKMKNHSKEECNKKQDATPLRNPRTPRVTNPNQSQKTTGQNCNMYNHDTIDCIKATRQPYTERNLNNIQSQAGQSKTPNAQPNAQTSVTCNLCGKQGYYAS